MHRRRRQRERPPKQRAAVRRRHAGLCGWLLVAGCYRGLEGGPAAVGDDDTDTGGDSGGASVPEDEPAAREDAAASCGPEQSPLRRLTNAQYVHTLQDLFPGHDFTALSSALPVDATRDGFENAAQTQVPSPALVEGYQRGALTVTRTVFADAETTATTIGHAMPGDVGHARELAATVIAELGPRIVRRPLADDELARELTAFDAGYEDTGRPADDFVVALSGVVAGMLQSPSFLFLVEHGRGESRAHAGDHVPLTSHEVASRLSYLLWDTMPDDELFAAAADDALRTAAQVEAQARRMLADPRARAAVVAFHRQWLGFDALLPQMKDSATYPAWSEEVLAGAYAQMGSYVEHVVFDGEGTIEALLTSRDYPVDARTAGVLGVDAPADDGAIVAMDPAQRAGLLTLPGILATLAHPVNPSPVLRGVFVRDRLLCSPLPPPPDDVDTSVADGDGEGLPQTNRERYEAHVADPACAGCHRLIDGIGFPLESYDATGAYRLTDAGQPVDVRGEIVDVGAIDGVVDGPIELASRLAASEQVAACVAQQWFRHVHARELGDGDACTAASMADELASSGGDIQDLVVALVRGPAFRRRRIPTE